MKRMLFFLLTSSSVIASLLHAVTGSVNTRDRFQKTITKSPFVVAYVYDSCPADEQQSKRCRNQEIKKNLDILNATSKDGRYANAEIKFISADTHKGSLQDLSCWYNLDHQDNFLLFQKGKTVPERLSGPIARADLEELIEQTWNNQINGILADKEEERKLRIAEQRAAWAYWGTGYWFNCGLGCYGNCGYGCAPYNWGCNWGCGGRGPFFGCNVGYYC